MSYYPPPRPVPNQYYSQAGTYAPPSLPRTQATYPNYPYATQPVMGQPPMASQQGYRPPPQSAMYQTPQQRPAPQGWYGQYWSMIQPQ